MIVILALLCILFLEMGTLLPRSILRAPSPNQQEPRGRRTPPGSQSGSRDDPWDNRSPEAEMLDRAAIQYRDAEQKKIVKAAEDILRWCKEMKPQNSESWQLRPPDSRSRINEIEKSAHRIRTTYGVGATMEQLENPPDSWDDGIRELDSTATQLVEDVKKTRRQVISVPVITASDKIVLLCRWLKEAARTAR